MCVCVCVCVHVEIFLCIFICFGSLEIIVIAFVGGGGDSIIRDP